MIRIAICGIHIESSTFTPYLSVASDFTVKRGDELLRRYPWLTRTPIPGAEQVPAALEGRVAHDVRPWAEEVEWVPILHASALPGGPVDPQAYAAWKAEILETLAAADTLDGLFFDIHGAMSVPGLDDAEGDLITAIREVIGAKPLVSASMDLHGNVSRALFDGCDLLTCYRMAPHEDAWVSRERAARNLAERLLAGRGKPAKALVHVPVLLPGEKTSTRMEPAGSLYGMIPGIEARPGVDDAAIWVGFAWADQPRCTGAVVVYGDDAGEVERGALDLAQRFWQVRRDFAFVAPTGSIEECLDAAVESPCRPFVISDSGDNPGAGGADDVTVALAAMLAQPALRDARLSALCASIFDPAAVRAADAVGTGAVVEVELGGHVDVRPPGPLRVSAEVISLFDDPDGLRSAVLRVGGISIIVTSRRTQYTMLSQFRRAGVDPRRTDIVVIKIGYLEPELHKLAADWLLALTPGGVDQDVVRLGHNKIARPMFPFDPDMPEPRLSATVIPVGGAS